MNNLSIHQPTMSGLEVFCGDICGRKYGHGDDDHNPDRSVQSNINWRVANDLGRNEIERLEFFNDQERGVIPAGRIKANAGIPRLGTYYNCFVLAIFDTFIGTREQPGIFDTLGHASHTMGHGGGCGYNFSRVRPKEASVRDASGLASGPLSMVLVYNRSGQMVSSAGGRRGAQMGVLNVSHPDIMDFISAKIGSDEFKGFNLSVGVSDAFLEVLAAKGMWDLTHEAKPGVDRGFGKSPNGDWIYDRIPAVKIWDAIMQSTYACADPGVLLLDRINDYNPLNYIEVIDATNPCGEQALPPMAACLLGSINLAKYIIKPFADHSRFDWDQFAADCRTLTKMLDRVIDVSSYPLDQQREEAMSKRRLGMGITGLGSALAMLGCKYSSHEGRLFAEKVVREQQTENFLASVELAKLEGAFPLYDEEKYCSTKYFQTLEPRVQDAIRNHGVRNSHVGSIAPCGTISIAFGGNCSSGLEPMFALKYDRKVKQNDGSSITTSIKDYAVAEYEKLYGETETFPDYFETAMNIDPKDHIRMVAALQPSICSSISKTINVPVDFPFEEFEGLYMFAFDLGVKGMTTFRPNPHTGSVLDDGSGVESLESLAVPGDKLFQLESISPENGWDWKDETDTPPSSDSHTYDVKHPALGRCALTVCDNEYGPFEVWAAGSDMPRNLGAIAMTLSQDMRLSPLWASRKLRSFLKTEGPDAFEFTGPDGKDWRAPSLVAGFAKLVIHRLDELGIDTEKTSPIEESMFLTKEPKTRGSGGMSFHQDVLNPATGDDFTLFVKEVKMPNGNRRPYSVWVSGKHNPTLTGLVISLSLDMCVYDVKWIERKLIALTEYSEAQGDFMSFIPGNSDGKQLTYKSTVAYVAAILLNRYRELGLIGDESQTVIGGGSDCPDCDRKGTYIPYAGCKECSACGYSGDCG